MSSWWRIYCENHGITITEGNSWAKIAAAHFNATDNACSHPKRLALLVSSAGSPGLPAPPDDGVSAGILGYGWTRQLAEDDVDTGLQSSSARTLALVGGRAPLT